MRLRKRDGNRSEKCHLLANLCYNERHRTCSAPLRIYSPSNVVLRYPSRSQHTPRDRARSCAHPVAYCSRHRCRASCQITHSPFFSDPSSPSLQCTLDSAVLHLLQIIPKICPGLVSRPPSLSALSIGPFTVSDLWRASPPAFALYFSQPSNYPVSQVALRRQCPRSCHALSPPAHRRHCPLFSLQSAAPPCHCLPLGHTHSST